ncbi:MAG: hypothetical protein U0414_29415 [Polyangiaceae bacterium]
MQRTSLWAWFVLGSLVGCGGKVTWVPDSTGGGGDGSSSSHSTGSSPTGPTATTGTGTMSLCQTFCTQTGTCIFPSDCVAQCESLFVSNCFAEAQAIVTCATNNIDLATCNISASCDASAEAYTNCVNSSNCQGGTCSISEDSCSCAGTCFGNSVHAICTIPPNGLPDCTCYVGADPVGSCKETNGQACSLNEGCCAPFLQGVGTGP